MALLRALLLAVLAMAVAIAPAAPCTMARHSATAHRVAPDAVRATTHAQPVRALQAPGASEAPGDAGLHAGAQAVPAATAGDDGCPGHRHRAKGPACPAPCCTLGCQVALPAAAWVGAPLDYAPSDRVLILREDGVVDAHPLRIERPPRPAA